MGIYDREYYRDETGGSGWLSGTAPTCKMLILIIVAVFLAPWLLNDPQLDDLLSVSGAKVFGQGQVWRLATAAFVHNGGPIFLLFEMLFFWMVGREMESMYGGPEFLRMFLAAGLIGSLCGALVSYFGPSHGVGSIATGPATVTAVVVLFTLYYPSKEILLFFILPVQMWLLCTVYLGWQALMLLQSLRGGGGEGPGYVGAIAATQLSAAFYAYAYKRWDLRWSRLFSLWRSQSRPRLRVYQPEPRDKVSPLSASPSRSSSAASSSSSARSASSAYVPEEQLDAKLDEVLAKIAREGRGGLTEEEKRVLEEASQRARSRRNDRL
jgi:membrane associated rhomboid family serine protease